MSGKLTKIGNREVFLEVRSGEFLPTSCEVRFPGNPISLQQLYRMHQDLGPKSKPVIAREVEVIAAVSPKRVSYFDLWKHMAAGAPEGQLPKIPEKPWTTFDEV